MAMTPDAKSALARTIRGTSATSGGLRARLIEDLHNATETAYRLSVRAQDAGLDEAARVKRSRLESWATEQVRAQDTSKTPRSAEDFRRDAEKQAAYTWLNRIIVLRLMEATGLRTPKVVTGGWESRGYKDFRSIAPGLVRGDTTEGYAYLLKLIFDDLALELPGIFGSAGIADLVPMPPATLRHLVESLDDEVLESCWTDDMTLGWVYQYWNDPEREALDEAVKERHKIQRHEIASKTQMFTDRYMVDWLLQNSLGPMWLAMCQKHGWTAEVESDSTLDRLEERRVEWRAKREAGPENGGVDLTALMPLHSDAERRWAYYVPQPIPDDAVTSAPESIRDLKLIDPAVGSGHFLVVAFELLVALYKEEARHREQAGEPQWSDPAIVERILEHNLHGIDLDPRAVQIAAAALWLKAKTVSSEAKPKQLNLVAANLNLSSLPDNDPALLELRREVERETGIPATLTDKLIGGLKGADHLGSLLKIDTELSSEILALEDTLGKAPEVQLDLFIDMPEEQRLSMNADEAKQIMLRKLEVFLAKHTSGDDLGLRLRGEQLAAGVRFVRMVKEGAYDLVVANPPYHSATKLAGDATSYQRLYALGRADLFAAFILRSLELLRPGGFSASVTLSNWMFLKAFSDFRAHLLGEFRLVALGDLGKGSFSSGSNLISASTQVFQKSEATGISIALRPYNADDVSTDIGRVDRNVAALTCHVGRYEFDPAALKVVPEWPLVYWWGEEFLRRYADTPKLADESDVKQGMATADNTRFLRLPWEVHLSKVFLCKVDAPLSVLPRKQWAAYVKGAAGQAWLEPLNDIVSWHPNALAVKLFERNGKQASRPQNEEYYFKPSVVFPSIGADFSARTTRWRSVFGNAGLSLFMADLSNATCLLNCNRAREIVNALNPTVNFLVGDVTRLPVLKIGFAKQIVSRLDTAFTVRESHREPSVEFTHPGPSPWRHAQDWAQLAVDRPEADPLPEYIEELDPEPPTDHMSFALGVALGRFGPNQEGILDPATADLAHALPAGICFLDRTLTTPNRGDCLEHPAAAPLHAAWETYSIAIGSKRKTLRDYLALDFFKDVHKGMYENRPIHWPLSSANKTFVAWINIHRMNERTLRVLHADHLAPALTRIEGELNDLRTARDGADAKAARAAEKLKEVQKAKNELVDFIAMVTQCADRGAPVTDPKPAKCTPREVDARYTPDLDDGVMINSAALWPLLLPQWKDPKEWFTELSLAKGRKDYDWSHLAMRYWPTRTDKKCQEDPSLGVAHGCFWAYHPERAWAWELRLQDEIGPDFRIEEASYRGDGGDAAHRAAYLRDHAEEALAAVEKEALRRRGRGKDAQPIAEMTLLEPGLWSALPAECWALEDRIMEKQEARFRLHAPDEAEARTQFETEHPREVLRREQLESKFTSEPEQPSFKY